MTDFVAAIHEEKSPARPGSPGPSTIAASSQGSVWITDRARRRPPPGGRLRARSVIDTEPWEEAAMVEGPGEPVLAGDFSSWMAATKSVIEEGQRSDVPCGTCTACCRSAQFVHIGPNETATLARIPAELLFPAPGLPAGNVLLGYDELGNCPMLVDDRCSIYEDRPRTCRVYDCRVLSLIHISEPTRRTPISYAVFC